jgi:hypothetical protein
MPNELRQVDCDTMPTCFSISTTPHARVARCSSPGEWVLSIDSVGGGLEEAGDSMSFNVNVPSAGEYWSLINYANGSLRHN